MTSFEVTLIAFCIVWAAIFLLAVRHMWRTRRKDHDGWL